MAMAPWLPTPARPHPPGGRRRPRLLDVEAVHLHGVMLDDRARTARFIEALRAAVRPGDVVVDVGTGTGVLAVAAAQAGAGHVYAIDAGDVAGWARRVVQANGVGDRVTVLRGLSAHVGLSERCDVLVAELIGNDPLAEGIIEVTRDARRRFLKPNARLVPSGLAIYGVPTTLPDREREHRVLGHDRLERWHEWYGIDFTPLQEAWGGAAFIQYVAAGVARTWTALGPPALLARYELAALGRPRIGGERRMRITQAGSLEALILYFELRSGATTFLSTVPTAADGGSHWLVPVRILSTPVDVRPGDRIAVHYRPGAITLA